MSEQLVTEHLELSPGEIGPLILLPGSVGRAEYIAMKALNQGRLVRQNPRHLDIYAGFLDGREIFVIPSGMGCPSAKIVLDEIGQLLPKQRKIVIRPGTAGALQPHMSLGDLTISMTQVRDEGTTRSMLPAGVPPTANWDVLQALMAAAGKHAPGRHHCGAIHCKDDLAIEVPDKNHPMYWRNKRYMDGLRGSGILSTSMEGAVLFAKGMLDPSFCCGEVLVNIGLVHAGASFSSQEERPTADCAIRVALEAMRILIGRRFV